MSDDKLDFIDGNAPAEPQVEDTPAITPEPDPAPAEAKGEPAAPPAAPEERPAGIPISALLDEREKRQKAEREAEELRQYRRRQEEQQRAAQMKAPDLLENPDGRLQFEQQRIQHAMWNERLNMSEMIARQAHGEQAVTEAAEAFKAAVQQNPALQMELHRQANPYGFVMNWHRQQKVLTEIGSDLDGWRKKQEEAMREKIRAELLAEQQQQPAQPQPKLPGSLAAAPAAGRAGEPRARGSAFDAAFGG